MGALRVFSQSGPHLARLAAQAHFTVVELAVRLGQYLVLKTHSRQLDPTYNPIVEVQRDLGKLRPELVLHDGTQDFGARQRLVVDLSIGAHANSHAQVVLERVTARGHFCLAINTIEVRANLVGEDDQCVVQCHQWGQAFDGVPDHGCLS